MALSVSEKQKISIRNRIEDLCAPKAPIPTKLSPELKILSELKAVYFDVYGTIMISGTEPNMRTDGSREEKLLKKSFDAFGLSYTDELISSTLSLLRDAIERSHDRQKKKGVDYPEVDIIQIWRNVINEIAGREDFEGMDKDKVPEFLTDFVIRYDDPWLMPGLENTVEAIQDHGLELGIISNSQFYTPLTLEALSGKNMEELGFPGDSSFWSFAEDIAKPSVRFYELAADHLSRVCSIKPEEVLFVGNDMLNDVYPAHKAGFQTALFAGDQRSLRLRDGDERVKGLKPDIILTSLPQIIKCLP